MIYHIFGQESALDEIIHAPYSYTISKLNLPMMNKILDTYLYLVLDVLHLIVQGKSGAFYGQKSPSYDSLSAGPHKEVSLW